jgi:hypothetical protein
MEHLIQKIILVAWGVEFEYGCLTAINKLSYLELN